MPALTCYNCQHTWPISPPITRSEECPNCRRDAKVCLNCRFHNSHAHRECQESQASWVKDKEKGNFCDYFEPAQRSGDGLTAAQSAKAKATADLDALFGGGGAASSEGTGKGLADELAQFLKDKK